MAGMLTLRPSPFGSLRRAPTAGTMSRGTSPYAPLPPSGTFGGGASQAAGAHTIGQFLAKQKEEKK
jgi:hypothetical protein